MLKQISIVFSLLLVVGFSETFFDFRHAVKAQSDQNDPTRITNSNSTVLTSTASSQGLEMVVIPIEDLVISKSSQGLVELSASLRNNHTFDVHDIKIMGEFFDKEGNSLGKIDEYVTQPSHMLKPNEKYSFSTLEVISHYKLGSTNVTGSAIPNN
jgi:hypothetical protein